MKTFLKVTALLLVAMVIFLLGHFTTIHHSLPERTAPPLRRIRGMRTLCCTRMKAL